MEPKYNLFGNLAGHRMCGRDYCLCCWMGSIIVW